MKRMTALIIAGVLLLGTACGGENQTNSGGTQADAGATSVQEQEAGSLEGQEAGPAQEQEAGSLEGQEAGSAEGQTAGSAEGQTAGSAQEQTADSSEESAKGDAIIKEDENAFSGDGTVTAFIGEPFYDGVIKDYDEAYKAVQSVYDRIGADETTKLELAEVRITEDNICYTFLQMAGDIRVYGDAVKLITDNDGKAIGLVSAILPNVKAAPADAWGVTAEEAEAIIEDNYKEEDVHVVAGATDQVLIPLPTVANLYCYAWVVYTENIYPQYDTAYLAHYVKSDGEYLYAIPISEPHNADVRAGDITAFAFDKMEEAEWTGTIRHHDGREEEITVPVMKDTVTGKTVLGDVKRKILCADYADYAFKDTLTPRALEDGASWDDGWTGPDGFGTPSLLLMNLVYENGNPIDNACYCGREKGFQIFAFNAEKYGDCLDVLGHEFTHCVTGTTMTTNLYMNDYGAINEAMSDIMGNLIEMTFEDNQDGAWLIAENHGEPMRSLKDPNEYSQPGYFWDEYFVPNVEKITDLNDKGGVHTNSSLLNVISYKLYEAGMSNVDQDYFWTNVAIAMTPRTDFAQLAEILPWCMKSAGFPQYEEVVRKALEETGYANRQLPENAGEGKALITFTYSLPEKYQKMDSAVILYDQDGSEREIWTWPEGGTDRVAAVVREGSYAVAIIIDGADMEEETYYLYSENGWEEYDYNSLFDKFKEKDEKCIIEVGSGERKELAAPEW